MTIFKIIGLVCGGITLLILFIMTLSLIIGGKK